MQPISALNTQQLVLSSRRRTGKVAHLPAATREKLNQMLDDGLPYADIIQALGPEAAHLTPDNLSNWSRGGFQDWLVLQDRHSLAEDIYHHIAQHDQPDDPDALYEKTVRIAAAQVCAALALFPRPDPDSENFIDHIKALSQILARLPGLTNSAIKISQHRSTNSPEAMKKFGEHLDPAITAFYNSFFADKDAEPTRPQSNLIAPDPTHGASPTPPAVHSQAPTPETSPVSSDSTGTQSNPIAPNPTPGPSPTPSAHEPSQTPAQPSAPSPLSLFTSPLSSAEFSIQVCPGSSLRSSSAITPNHTKNRTARPQPGRA